MFTARRRAQELPRLEQRIRRQSLEILGQGVNADIQPTQLPPELYSRCLNMEISDLGMKASAGHKAAFGATLFPPEHLAFTRLADTFYWLYLSGLGAGVTDGSSHFDVSPLIPFTSNWPSVSWTDTNINDFPVVNNAVDAPLFWDNSPGSILAPLPGWDPQVRAGAVRSFTKALIAMNITDAVGNFNNFLLWSNSAEPGEVPTEWSPLPENDAGFNTLSDTRGTLLDGQQFRDNFLLFKQHSTYIMTYIGGNFVYAFRKLFTTTGILSANCSAEFLGNVIALTDGDVIVTDGQSAHSIIDKQNRDWLFKQIDSDNYRNSFVTAYHAQGQVWICFPENGEDECTIALVWDQKSAKWGVRELTPKASHIARGQVGAVTGTVSWDEDPENWNQDLTIWNESIFNPTEDALLQADRSGLLTYAVGEGQDWNGQPQDHYLERTGLDFGDLVRHKYIYAMILRITGPVGSQFNVRVGSSSSDQNVVSWAPTQLYTLGESSQAIFVQVQGRFIAYSIQSVGLSSQWFLQGVEFMFDWRGRY